MVINIDIFHKHVHELMNKRSKGIHIKNKFYTRVRKAVRQVNSVIDFYFTKKYTPFEFTIISKLVSLISRHVEETKYEKKDISIEEK